MIASRFQPIHGLPLHSGVASLDDAEVSQAIEDVTAFTLDSDSTKAAQQLKSYVVNILQSGGLNEEQIGSIPLDTLITEFLSNNSDKSKTAYLPLIHILHSIKSFTGVGVHYRKERIAPEVSEHSEECLVRFLNQLQQDPEKIRNAQDLLKNIISYTTYTSEEVAWAAWQCIKSILDRCECKQALIEAGRHFQKKLIGIRDIIHSWSGMMWMGSPISLRIALDACHYLGSFIHEVKHKPLLLIDPVMECFGEVIGYAYHPEIARVAFKYVRQILEISKSDPATFKAAVRMLRSMGLRAQFPERRSAFFLQLAQLDERDLPNGEKDWDLEARKEANEALENTLACPLRCLKIGGRRYDSSFWVETSQPDCSRLCCFKGLSMLFSHHRALLDEDNFLRPSDLNLKLIKEYIEKELPKELPFEEKSLHLETDRGLLLYAIFAALGVRRPVDHPLAEKDYIDSLGEMALHQNAFALQLLIELTQCFNEEVANKALQYVTQCTGHFLTAKYHLHSPHTLASIPV